MQAPRRGRAGQSRSAACSGQTGIASVVHVALSLCGSAAECTYLQCLWLVVCLLCVYFADHCTVQHVRLRAIMFPAMSEQHWCVWRCIFLLYLSHTTPTTTSSQVYTVDPHVAPFGIGPSYTQLTYDIHYTPTMIYPRCTQ